MDSYREHSGEYDGPAAETAPPADAALAIGTDERRMHVRAYNYWVSLLDGRDYPSIEDLEPGDVADFAANSVLLDFTCGRDNPATPYIGAAIREECDLDDTIKSISDVPSRSLLSRLTDHYMQIIANRAPVGFEAEFENQREEPICYRGILMPFSSDGDTIDFIYGVINWKRSAEAPAADVIVPQLEPLTPDSDEVLPEQVQPDDSTATQASGGPEVLAAAQRITSEELEPAFEAEVGDEDAELAEADFEPHTEEHEVEDEDEDEDEAETEEGDDQPGFASLVSLLPAAAPKPEPLELTDAVSEPPAHAFGQPFARPVDFSPLPVTEEDEEEIPVPELDADAALADRLWAARETAEAVKSADGRSRAALYQALALAHDFAVAAQANPEDYAELLEESGMKAQARAPMTPIVKLVFGIDYDKTRLTEFASALSHAQRQNVALGGFQTFIEKHPGGLKGLVAAERKAKRPEPGPDTRLEAARHHLRVAPSISLGTISDEQEFALVVTRRNADGVHEPVAVVEDPALIERAIRRSG